MGESDHQLAQRSLRGSEEAFQELVTRYEPKVTGLCRRILGGHADAEDAAITTFVKAWRSLGKYDPTRPFAAWLFTIAAREAISVARSRKEWRSLELDEGLLIPDMGAGAGADDPEARVIAAEERQGLLLALAKLDTAYRTAVVLRYQLDMSYDEIAGALQVPLGTVGTILHRAKQQLRKHLEEGNR